MSPLPAAAANLLGFARLLRNSGFSTAPEQAISFMQGVTLLGPRSMEDIRQAALATLAPPADRRGDFDALFRAWFWGDAEPAASGESDEEVRVKDHGAAREQEAGEPRPETGGEISSDNEQLATRRFAGRAGQLATFGQALRTALPTRRSFRNVQTRCRGEPDLRRSLRAIVGADGDVPRPLLRRRALVQRKLLLLIDISGSMKQHTADYLELAHAIVQNAERAEVFTIGTRLTRLTSSLRARDRAMALARAGGFVEDWDGGTRIGPTLLAFLAVPRFATFARGATIVLLTDGLERGSHAEMEVALRRLSARAYRLSLCTPLAADPRFRPRTAALEAVLPFLDDLVDGSSIEGLTRFILSLARPLPPAKTVWCKVS